jgi:hypothetical protein
MASVFGIRIQRVQVLSVTRQGSIEELIHGIKFL